MLKDERMRQIMINIYQHGSITVSKLSKIFNVTPETIRKDLEYLEKEGKLQRVFGGAILKNENIPEFNAKTRETINSEKKKNLAGLASEFVAENNFVALDDSTTNVEIAKALIENFNSLTCITNSIKIAQVLAVKPNMNILLAAGRLNNEDFFTYGSQCINFIRHYHPDIFFMSASGIDIKEGIMDYGFDQFDVKLAMKESSAKTYCALDSTKFGRTATIRVCNLNEVDGIITDDKISKDYIEQFNSLDINLFSPES